VLLHDQQRLLDDVVAGDVPVEVTRCQHAAADRLLPPHGEAAAAHQTEDVHRVGHQQVDLVERAAERRHVPLGACL